MWRFLLDDLGETSYYATTHYFTESLRTTSYVLPYEQLVQPNNV